MASSLAQLAGFSRLLSDLDDLRDLIKASGGWVVGTSTEYGFWLEVGTRDMPAYPWLRPAVRDVVENEADQLADEAASTEGFVKRLALAIERQAKENVSADRGNDRSPGTHPEHPTRQSSTLVNSIKAVQL